MRLSVWVSISFGIAIATSQMANAFIIVNRNEGQSKAFWVKDPEAFDWSKGLIAFKSVDEKFEYGHRISCGGTESRCGSGEGVWIRIAIYPHDNVLYRLIYPWIYMPPFGIIEYYKWGYYLSGNENIPSTAAKFFTEGMQQCQTRVDIPYPLPSSFWANAPMEKCNLFTFPANFR